MLLKYASECIIEQLQLKFELTRQNYVALSLNLTEDVHLIILTLSIKLNLISYLSFLF